MTRVSQPTPIVDENDVERVLRRDYPPNLPVGALGQKLQRARVARPIGPAGNVVEIPRQMVDFR